MCERKFSILNSLTYIVSGVGSSAPRCATQVIGHLEHTYCSAFPGHKPLIDLCKTPPSRGVGC
jgi:hypothetical protein